MGQGPEDGMVMWECQDSSSLQNKIFLHRSRACPRILEEAAGVCSFPSPLPQRITYI